MWNVYMHPIWNWINATVTILKLLIVSALVIFISAVCFCFSLFHFISFHLKWFGSLSICGRFNPNQTKPNKSTYMKRPTRQCRNGNSSDRYRVAAYLTICVLDYIGRCLFLTIFVSFLKIRKAIRIETWHRAHAAAHVIEKKMCISFGGFDWWIFHVVDSSKQFRMCVCVLFPSSKNL